jgi:hypothetical protein
MAERKKYQSPQVGPLVGLTWIADVARDRRHCMCVGGPLGSRATKLKVSTMSTLSALKADMRADMHQLRLRATLRRSIDDSLIELVPKNS